jgi:hypothetical protein
VLPLDPAAAVEEPQRRRAEIGFSYVVLGAEFVDTFAPTVAELAGHQRSPSGRCVVRSWFGAAIRSCSRCRRTASELAVWTGNAWRQCTLERVKTYTLLDRDGRPYQSRTPGVLGGHRRTRVFGRLDCPTALRWIAHGTYVQHRVFFAEEEVAIVAGYRPCGHCLREKYRQWLADEDASCTPPSIELEPPLSSKRTPHGARTHAQDVVRSGFADDVERVLVGPQAAPCGVP